MNIYLIPATHGLDIPRITLFVDPGAIDPDDTPDWVFRIPKPENERERQVGIRY